ncbi:hypothetical protein [Amycolatopsis benzoatilytica]|uniref:WXG100-like domain-containing protein n=1 Tax=Amycolatopsis benzoatilytica TaxID=346045 RepID=UPI0003A388DD|nr:hypothetical protein [Amycolatopsis benzoatilytica]
MADLLEPDGSLWRWVVANSGQPQDTLWPPDSETDAHNLAQAWTNAATAVGEGVQNSDQAAADLRAVWTDAAGFEQYYAIHSLNHGGNGEAGIADLVTAMTGLATLCQDYSNKVSSAKFLIRLYVAENEDLFAHCTSWAARTVFAISVGQQVAKIVTDLADKFGKPPEPPKPKKPHGFWGNVGSFFGGIYDGAKEGLEGFAALIGRGADGSWSWSTLGQAWGGMGKFALAAATYGNPLLTYLDQTHGLPFFERGEMGRTLVDAGKSLVAWDEWSEDPARAGGKATFNIVSSVLGTKGAGAAIRGGGAALAASKIGSKVGAVATAGRALETVGNAITKIPTATEVAGKVVRKIPGVENVLSKVGLGHGPGKPHTEEPPPPREPSQQPSEGGRKPPDDPPPPERTPRKPSADSPPAERPPAERSPGEHSPAEHPPAEDPPVEHPPAEHPSAESSPSEHSPSERSPSEQVSEKPSEHASEPPPEHGSVGESLAADPHHPGAETTPGHAASPAHQEQAGEHQTPAHAPGQRAVEHHQEQPAAQTPGSAESAAHQETGENRPAPSAETPSEPRTSAVVDKESPNWLEQEKIAGPLLPDLKTLPQKMIYGTVVGTGLVHSLINMLTGSGLDHPPMSAKVSDPPPTLSSRHRKADSAGPDEPAAAEPPRDPGLPPKFGELAVAHVDFETMKVDHIDPPEHLSEPHPAESRPTEPHSEPAPSAPAEPHSEPVPPKPAEPHPEPAPPGQSAAAVAPPKPDAHPEPRTPEPPSGPRTPDHRPEPRVPEQHPEPRVPKPREPRPAQPEPRTPESAPKPTEQPPAPAEPPTPREPADPPAPHHDPGHEPPPAESGPSEPARAHQVPGEHEPGPAADPLEPHHPAVDIDKAINPDPKPPHGHDPAENPHHAPADPAPHENPPHENDPGHHDPDPDPHHNPGHDDPNHDPNHDPNDPAPPPGPEPLTPDEVNARHAESTPSGSSYHAGDPELADLPHRVEPDPDGRYTVDVHVTPDGHARIGDRQYSPKQFADILRRNDDYHGQPIRLIGCDAGSNQFAHALARELDTEVTAPTKAAWTDRKGRVFSSDFEIGPDGKLRPRIPPDGEWNTHRPDGTVHRAGDDGFAPGSHHGDPHDIDGDSAVHRGDGDDLNPQHQIEEGWREPENFTPPGEDVRLGADENFFDKSHELRPDTRYNILDHDGNVRTRVYTDQNGKVSHVDAQAPNTLHGANPEVARPAPGADYRVQVGRRHDIYPTGPDGTVRTVTHNDVKTVHGKRDITRIDHVETPPEPARHTEVGPHDPRAPRADQPFSARRDLEPDTRYHVTDRDGNPRGSFQTDSDGNVKWIDTHASSDGLPNPDCEHRVANGNYRVDRGPNYQEFHVGADGRPEHAATWRQPPHSGAAVVHNGNLRQSEAFNRQSHVDAEGNSTLAGEREHRVTDDHGQFRGSFHTDADGRITHVDTTTGQRARTNPEIAHAPEGAKVTQDGFYGTAKAKAVQDSWPAPDREVVFSHEKKGGGFTSGSPDGWSDAQVKAVTDPFSGERGSPLTSRGDLPPNTRIHVVDQKGHPYSTVQTGPDGTVTHVHTFQPTNADLNYPPPGATVRVDHGLEVRNPDGSTRITEGDVHRTDSRGNTVATSGPPDAAGASQIRRDTTAQSEVGALGGKDLANRNIDDGGHHGSTSAGKGGESINMSTEGRIDNSNAGSKDVEATYDADDSWYQMERHRDEHLDQVAHEDVMPARDPGADDPHTRHYRSYGLDEQGRITVNVRSFPGDHNTPLWPRDFRR